MNLLALETATPVCSVALWQEERVSVLLTLDRPRAHAGNLVPMIADVLRYGRIEPAELDAVAVSSGPGSYTGLRIGTSTAKGLAAAVGSRLVAVPSLTALAERVRPLAAPNDRIAAAFDARRDEAYAALFRVARDGSLETVRETATVDAAGALEWIGGEPEATLFLVGGGWRKMADRIEPLSPRIVEGEQGRPSAASVARIGARKLERGDVEDIVAFEPYYLKEFVPTRPAASAFEKLSF